MSGDCGPLPGRRGKTFQVTAPPAPPSADKLLERSLDQLYAQLAGFIETHCVLREPTLGGDLIPDLDTLDDLELMSHALLLGLIIDIEEHLGLERATFSTATAPWWLRRVIQRGRELREHMS